MRSFDAEPVAVPLEACYCPGTPHEDGDVVYLAPVLSMTGGMAATSVFAAALEGASSIAIQEMLADIWVRHGVVGWNLLDEGGKPVELTPSNVAAALPYGKGGRLVAEKADDLYAEDITGPLVQRLSNISPTGPTNGSTSRTPKSSRKRQSRS